MAIQVPQKIPSTRRALLPASRKSGPSVHSGFKERVRGGQGAYRNSPAGDRGNVMRSLVPGYTLVSTTGTHSYSLHTCPPGML